jgi:hypothetical protein
MGSKSGIEVADAKVVRSGCIVGSDDEFKQVATKARTNDQMPPCLPLSLFHHGSHWQRLAIIETRHCDRCKLQRKFVVKDITA